MKRATIWLLIAAMLILPLSACSSLSNTDNKVSETPVSTSANTTNTTDTTDATDTSNTNRTAAEEEPTATAPYFPVADGKTLSIFVPVSPILNQYYKTPEDLAWIQYLEEKTNVQIDATLEPIFSASEQAALMFASGTFSDIVCEFSMFYQTGTSAALDDGVIYDLADNIQNYMPNYCEKLKSDNLYDAAFNDAGQMPCIYEIISADSLPEYGAVIRQDWLDALKLSVPETYDDIHNVLSAFQNEKGGSPLWIPSTGTVSADWLSAGYGISANVNSGNTPIYQVDGIVKYGLIQDEFKEYLNMLNTWYKEGLISTDFISSTELKNPDVSVLTSENKGLWFCNDTKITTYETGLGSGVQLSALSYPTLKAGDTTHLNQRKTGLSDGASITTSCSDPELACRVLDTLYSDEGTIFANFGTEGETFEYVDGKPQFTEMITKNPDGIALETLYSLYAMYNMPFYCEYERTLQSFDETQKNAVTKWAEESDDKWCMPKDVSLTSEENSEVSNTYSDINTYVSENIVKFIIGDRPLDEFDEFAADIKGMGIDKIVKLYQTAYNRKYS